MNNRDLKLVFRLPDAILNSADPETVLCASVLQSLAVAVAAWCILCFSLFGSYFVARRGLWFTVATALLSASLVALFQLRRAARDPRALGSPAVMKARVRRAGWVLIAAMGYAFVAIVLSGGGIAGRGILLMVALIVAAGGVFGESGAWAAGGLSVAFTLTLALLAQRGVQLPQTSSNSPMGVWALLAFASALATFPLARIFSALRGVTARERDRAQEVEHLNKALRESEERMRTIVETAPDAIFILGLSGRVIEVNDAALRQLGYRREELVGMHLTDFVAPEFKPRAQAECKEFSFLTFFESLHVRKDGVEVPVEINARKITYRGAPAMLGVARDLTERRHIRERLRALNGQLVTTQERESRRVARDLHDDVTQRLAGLSIELGLLRRQPNSPVVAATLAHLQEQAARVAEDVRNIAHQIHPGVLEHVGLPAALEAFCSQVSRQRGIAVRYSSEGVLDEIPKDISMVPYRIAQEAVGNAVKHSEASLIEVTLAGVAGPGGARRLRLTVTDNGKGFPEDPAGRGAGLGLLSIEERVHLVKGSFVIHSTPGEGSSLEVEIPLPAIVPEDTFRGLAEGAAV